MNPKKTQKKHREKREGPKSDRRAAEGETSARAGEAVAPARGGIVQAPTRPGGLVAGSCTLLVLLQWAAPFLPDHVVWGIHHLAYAPLWARSLWTIIVLLLLWSPGPFLAWLEQGIGRALSRSLAPIALVLMGGVLFWLLRNKTYFMGDGYLVGELVDRGVPFRTYDFLDFFLHAAVWKLFQSGEGVSSFTIYAWASILAGLGYLLAARWVSLRLGEDASSRTLLFALLVFAGPLELFFGYVESYSFQTVFILLYLGAAILALRGEGPLWRASIFFGLALAFHTTTLFLAPTLIYLALARAREMGILRRAASTLLPAGGVVVVAVVVLFLSGYTLDIFERDVVENRHTREMLLPLFGQHGLLSVHHLKDLVNLVLLLIPIPSLLLLATLLRRPRALWEDHERRFLTVGAILLTLLLIGIDRKLGGARDWDLFASHISVVTLLAALSWRSWACAERATGKAAFLMVAAFAMVGPWAWVNAGEGRSIARFRDIITDFSSFKKAYAHEEIGKHFRNKEDLEEAVKEYQLCVETFPGNPRFWAILGAVKVQAGQVERAIEDYKKALEIDPESVMAQRMLIQAYQVQGRAEETLPLFRNLVPKLGKDAGFWAQYGIMARVAGEHDTAVQALRNSLELKPSPNIKLELAVTLGMAGRWDAAAGLFRELQEDTKFRDRATLGLATTFLLQSQKDPDLHESQRVALLRESREYLEAYLSENPDEPEPRQTLERVKALLELGKTETGE